MKLHPEFLGIRSASPGVCWLCRRSKNATDAVIDLQRDIDMEGAVQLCETCAVEMGHLVGMITPTDRRNRDDLRSELAKETERADLAEEALDRLSSVYDARQERRKNQAKRDAAYVE